MGSLSEGFGSAIARTLRWNGLAGSVLRRIGKCSAFLLVAAVLCLLCGTQAAHAQADLAAGLGVDNPSPNVGDTITFTFTVTNLGPQSATSVFASDVLPASLSFVSATPSVGSYNSSNGLWTIGTVDTVTPATLLIRATVTSPTAATNTANIISAVEADPNPGNNSASATVTPQQADLSIAKIVDNPTPNAGATINYTITLSNAGPNTATNVTVQDLLPAGLTFVSATPSQGTYSSGTGTWTVGTVTAGVPQTLTIAAQVASSTALTNTATVSHSDQYDPSAANNSASATITPAQADLALSKTVDNAAPNVGDTITYTITLSNIGPNQATGVTVQDLLPAGLSLVSASPSQGSYILGTGTWTVGTVTTITPQTLTIRAVVTAANNITNTATVSHSDQFDPNTANNAASATISPTQADLALSKTVSNANPAAGDTITYTVKVTNGGPAQATGVTVQDILPAGLSFVSATPSQGTYNNGTGLWTVGTVTTATPQTLGITAKVTGSGAITNTATISHSDQADPAAGNNTASVSVTVGGVAPPVIAASFGAASIPLNGTTSLTFTISNPGHAVTLTGVGFTDALPAGLVVATPSGVSGSCGAGTITAAAGGGSVNLANGSIPANGSCSFSVNVTGTSAGVKTNTTSVVTSNEAGSGNAATASVTVGAQSPTTTTLTSSLNPSQVGQAVTFTATVSSSGGAPAGTVTFKDGATVIGTAALSAGAVQFTTASLTLGSHNITASFGGGPSFVASTSSPLTQVVNTPSDSLKLRAMQVLAAPVAAQVSGDAISGAVNAAVTEGFADGGGAFVAPNGSGLRFNFAADPDAQPAAAATSNPTDPFASLNGTASGTRNLAASRGNAQSSRVDDAFGALAYAAPTKAPPRPAPAPDWLGWAEVHGAVLNRWNSAGALGTPTTAPMLYGNQVNWLMGLTRKLQPNFLVGVLGGYENFDYRSDALQGRLKGDGWTVGSYLGWMLNSNLRFDAAVAYSGIGFDGMAGTAAATFGGHRWLVSGGLTGTYATYGFQIEPSARIYALWEREDAYTDSLGTMQTARNFSTGRASGGVKVVYPVAWSPTVQLAPYVGLYGDYYFNTDDATAALVAPAIPAAIVLDGWSARAIGGLNARLAGGAQISVGGERSGIGSGFSLWTYRARASVPFSAQ
ncbi:putative repeat protein (TIGR01451 family) [Bradyrhizobium macuxiense]|uniref:Putative repeat protein (TIGR01451 family) n=1 Tax=Bradyrhizobium macuxiense TaxID=1755647 RepID=A0A560LR65_9BRAD|nr:Ig-like domain repeat protein [Bradyrhizobium macuxiense]TWB98053.1 putative repeat protein (TIGR01451 family) [Bradyrhizobium macuxiense]